MYAYGTFYDRMSDERVKVIIPNEIVDQLLDARKKSDEEFEAIADGIFEEHVKEGGVIKYIAYGGLMNVISESDGSAFSTPVVADEEEYVVAYGYDEEAVKVAFHEASEEYDDEEWDED